MRYVEPILVRRHQHPRIAESFVCSVTIVELPSEPTVTNARKGAKRNALEDGREPGLKGNPEGVVRADRCKRQW